jgi:hypothetical protein
MKYSTEEYQRRLHLRNSAKEFIVILKSVNDLNEAQLEKLRNYYDVLDFMVDLGFYSEFNVPDNFKNLLKYSDTFFMEVERYKTFGKVIITQDEQIQLLGGFMGFSKFVEINKPVLDSMERKRCMQTAFDYSPVNTSKNYKNKN